MGDTGIEAAPAPRALRSEVLALRASEARLRLATESAGLGIWELEVASGDGVRSAVHAAIFGDDLAEAWSAESLLRHVIPEDRPKVERVIAASLAAASAWCVVCRIRRGGDGALRWIELRCAPVPEPSGETRRYVGSVGDITERMRAEAARLREAEELERSVVERSVALARANARLTEEIAERKRAEAALVQAHRLEAIGQVVGGVAHCFNNLLAAVIGNLDLLGADALPERTRRLLDRALRAAWRGSALNQQLLAYARQQNFEPHAFDLNAALAALRQALAEGVGELVRIETDFAADLWPALGEAAQLGQVVLALALNARDAMPGGGRLTLATRNVPAGAGTLPVELARGDYVMLAVADAGGGMAPEVLARACEPFFTTKDVGAGNGLGLAQADGIARQFGGTLRLRSTLGAGTTVEVLLPRALA
jgi:PAS domain S-box-containing protein